MASRLSLAILVVVALLGLASAQVERGTECGKFSVRTMSGQYIAYNLTGLSGRTFNYTSYNVSFSISFCESNGTRLMPEDCGFCADDTMACMETLRFPARHSCLGTLGYYYGSRNGTSMTFLFNGTRAPNNLTVYVSCNKSLGYDVRFQRIAQSYAGVTVWAQSGFACGRPDSNSSNTTTPVAPPSALNCSQAYGNCDGCLSGQFGRQCVFCMDTGTCMDGFMPRCTNYFKKREYCRRSDICTRFKTCKPCASSNPQTGCFWCPDAIGRNGTCVPSGSFCADGMISDPAYCEIV